MHTRARNTLSRTAPLAGKVDSGRVRAGECASAAEARAQACRQVLRRRKARAADLRRHRCRPPAPLRSPCAGYSSDDSFSHTGLIRARARARARVRVRTRIPLRTIRLENSSLRYLFVNLSCM